MNKWVFFIFYVILIPLASASVQIDSSDIFRINNADINFSSTWVFNNIDVGGTYIDFTGNRFVIIPTSPINITILTWNTTGDYHKTIIASSDVHDNPTQFIMGGFPANTLIQVQVDGANWNRFTSDASGYISVNYNGWSDHQFDFFLPVGICEGVSSSINIAFTLFGVVLIFVALGGFILSLRSLNAVLLMSSIVLVMVGGVLVYVGLFAVASLGVVVC